ncbi:MAG: helix-turn-helix transcriptional regulator [Nostocaceae cyanobacterium]|nr:helix-turn-helix transcriptional regulator [Nostocaceae cyanobacterium]
MHQTLIRWRLKEVMARYNIKGVGLAKRLDISTNAMSTLRNAKTMPRLDGVALNLLCNALNELAEDLDKSITPADLLDYSQDPLNPTDADKVFSLAKRGKANQQKSDNSDTTNSLNLKLITDEKEVA